MAEEREKIDGTEDCPVDVVIDQRGHASRFTQRECVAECAGEAAHRVFGHRVTGSGAEIGAAWPFWLGNPERAAAPEIILSLK